MTTPIRFVVDGYNTTVELTVSRNESGMPTRIRVDACDPETSVGPAAVRQFLAAEGLQALNVTWDIDAYLSGVMVAAR